jgi:hypothetical protein
MHQNSIQPLVIPPSHLYNIKKSNRNKEKKMNLRRLLIFALLGTMIITIIAACGANQTAKDQIAPTEDLFEEEASIPAHDKETPAPPPEQKNLRPAIYPGVPPQAERILADSDASLRSYEHRVLSGDNFLDNLYERPFTSQEMIYQPDLDIYTVDFAHDENFFYYTIHLNGFNEGEGGLKGFYMVEFDLTLDGRGDLIVMTLNPRKKWTIKNVFAFTDENDDVGGIVPMVADEGFEGDGYDRRVQLEEDRVVFSRLAPADPQAVQIAVSRALLDNPEEFLWGAWADHSSKKFSEFDYNDSMGLSEAGSPFVDNEDYPIKALYKVDNTCRLPYGFEQGSASIPGICINVGPTPVPSSGSDCTMVCLDWCSNQEERWCCGGWECQ